MPPLPSSLAASPQARGKTFVQLLESLRLGGVFCIRVQQCRTVEVIEAYHLEPPIIGDVRFSCSLIWWKGQEVWREVGNSFSKKRIIGLEASLRSTVRLELHLFVIFGRGGLPLCCTMLIKANGKA